MAPIFNDYSILFRVLKSFKMGKYYLLVVYCPLFGDLILFTDFCLLLDLL